MSRRSVQRRAWRGIYNKFRPGLEPLSNFEILAWIGAIAFVLYLFFGE